MPCKQIPGKCHKLQMEDIQNVIFGKFHKDLQKMYQENINLEISKGFFGGIPEGKPELLKGATGGIPVASPGVFMKTT